MILDIHARAINTLASSYRALPWYKKLFFPKKIASALAALPASSDDYTVENTWQFVIAYLNTSSFFSAYFNCLNQILSTPLMTAVMAVSPVGFIERPALTEIVAPYRAAFRMAAEIGNVDQLRSLCDTYPAMVEEMVSDDNYAAFFLAVKNGHLPVLEYLEAKAPGEFQRMIAAKDHYAFRIAAENGHLPILEYLEAQAPGEFQGMIAAKDHYAFRIAAENGHLPILEYLEAQAPGEFQRMIAAHDYYVFRGAARKGHLPVLEYLEAKAPGKFQRMIAANDYYAFRGAARNGHLPVLEYLETKAPGEFQRMIAVNDYYAFREAAKNGHLPVLEYLEAKAPGEFQRMIAANDYYAFCEAARNGHLPVLEYLEAKAPGGLHRSVVLSFDRTSAINGILQSRTTHHPIIERILVYPTVYAYAEMHLCEYGTVVSEYTTKLLAKLQEQKTAFEQSQPTGIFDVDVEQAQQLVYVARYFIRLNTPEAHDQLVSLLRIPALRALAHQTFVVTPGNNELLRLALSLNNQQAAQSLLAIPEVRALAERNDFYRTEARGNLDLRALAQNRESSMTALTQGERQRLHGVTSRYQPMVRSAGVEAVMQSLREALQSRYTANPASITVKRGWHTQQIQLPLTWEAFNALGLNPAERKTALEAYYAHKDHTALRYLSKPNPWLHERASYVYVNPANTQEKWSTFDEYMELIGILYLAAKDEDISAIDGYTLQTRIEQFIAELAFIGRAHNWDNSRTITNAQGRSVLQEYDDLEGDRPSCYSGTLRRLFQSVLGHPLLKLLTPEILEQEIQSFIYNRFSVKLAGLSDDDHRLIKSAWDKLVDIEEPSEEEQGALRALNITPAEQETLIQDLTQCWGEQFSRDTSYTRKITETFSLASDEFHLTKFDYVHPENLFRETPLASAAAAPPSCSVATSRDTFFAGITPTQADAESHQRDPSLHSSCLRPS